MTAQRNIQSVQQMDALVSIQRLEHSQYILQRIESWPPLSAAQPTHRSGSLLVRGDNVWDGQRYVKAPDVTLRGAVPLEFDRGDWAAVST